jgi:hypothetical protein
MAMSQDRDEALSRLYRQAAVAEPSPAVDALILAAARRQAAEPLTAPRVSGGWRCWLAPVGVLATILLTVSLTLNIEREQRDLLPTPAAPPIPKSFTATPQQATVAPPAEAAKPALSAERRAKAQAEGLPARAPAAAQIQGGEIQRDEMRAVMPTPQFVPSPATAVEGAAGRMSSTESAGPAAVRAPAPAVADKRERAMAKATIRAPDDWIEEIRRLKREGRAVEVRQQLEAFQRAYPDYRLPEDLKPD